MSATNFIINTGSAAPQGGEVQLVNKPAQIPALGFNLVDPGGPAGYPSSGTPAAPTFGLGNFQALSGVIDATYDQDRFIWVVPAPMVVVSIVFCQSAIENTSNTTTVDVRKCANLQAPSAGTTLLAAAINLKTGVVATTVLSAPLTATTANLTLAANDQIALDFTNAITEYVGFVQVNCSFI